MRETVRRGEAVRDPRDAPRAVELAARVRYAGEHPWRHSVFFLAPLALLAVWALLDGRDWRVVVAVSAVLVAIILLGRRIARPYIRRNVRHAVEAEKRNREIARLHGLEMSEGARTRR